MSVAQSQPYQHADSRGLLSFGACSDRAGREVNEDNCTSEALRRKGREQLGTLAAIADGMGGGEAGKTASNIAIGALGEGYFESGSDQPLASLQHAVAQANSAVYAFTVTARKANPVGTTIVAAAVAGAQACLVSVGDSRAYLIRAGQIRQLTRDHNWANQQIDSGRMSAEQAYAHENAPLLTSVLGQGASLQIPLNGQPDGHFSFQFELQPGDALLLCSDGVTNVVPPEELARLALSGPAQQAAEQIVARAKARHTTDNATALLLHYGTPPRAAGAGLPRWLLPAGGAAAAVIVLLLALGLAFAGGGGGGASKPPSATSSGGSVGLPGQPEASPSPEPTLRPGETRQPTSTPLAATQTAAPAATAAGAPAMPKPPQQLPGNSNEPSTARPRATQASSPTSVPPTPTPVVVPTETPVVVPTETPVVVPTEAPVVVPTSLISIPEPTRGSGGGGGGGGGGDEGGGGEAPPEKP